MQRDAKEVMAEVLRKLTGRAVLDAGVVNRYTTPRQEPGPHKRRRHKPGATMFHKS